MNFVNILSTIWRRGSNERNPVLVTTSQERKLRDLLIETTSVHQSHHHSRKRDVSTIVLEPDRHIKR
ncbi:hypothetical protein BCR34DRAFT_557181 [Clohesyomyces aquaticus]|uniref:Uncharacterized protein n=1 Tax=Clohesyomyces aquaticus TaxID=1231657 RepID=A0A1Y2A1X6_9PLEO|nr:hypothetical protein BCR34DRAFT_557181 [Clohesyomyces aquaticus]